MKSTRKIMSIVLSIMLVLSCLPMSAISVSAAADLTTTIDTGATITLKDTNSDGYYEIGTADELYAFATIVNDGKLTIKAILTNDIVVNDGELTEDSTDIRLWTPIGNRDRIYWGTFDGNNKTISGLYYNNTNINYVGLFGYINSSGVVKDLGIINSYLNGKKYVGGIVGFSYGKITNCYNKGTVSGEETVGGITGYVAEGKVTHCYNKGKINGGVHIGGIMGSISNGTVTNCYNEGEVYGDNNVGGLVGSNVNRTTGLLTNSFNIGDINGKSYSGGVIGFDNTKNITSCYYLDTCFISGVTRGDVAGSYEAKTTEQFESGEVAYLLGEAFGQTIGTDMLPVFGGETVYQNKKCNENKIYYSNIEENDVHVPETIKGYDSTCTETGLTDGVGCSVCEEILTPQEVINKKEHSYEVLKGYDATCTETGLQDGVKCTVCGDIQQEIIPAKGHTLDEEQICTVCSYKYTGPLDTDGDGFYEIDTVTKLYWLAEQVNSGNTSINVILTADVTVNDEAITEESSDAKVWTPIGVNNSRYSGIFDGNNKTVSGLYFNDSSYEYVGLFGCLTFNGEVKNVSVANSYFNGKACVGSVVGCNYGGTITNCNSSSIVNTDENSEEIGGVVGFVREGVVENCYNTGTVSGSSCVGGVIGRSYVGTIRNCYNIGAISGNSRVGGVFGINGSGKTTNCYNIGNITGNGDYVGGVMGYNGDSSTDCYNKGNVISKGSYVGGVAGYSGSRAAINFDNEGNVSGRDYVGGVIGEINYGGSGQKVANCKNTGDVNGQVYVGGVFGASFIAATDSYNTGAVSGFTCVGGVVGYSESKVSNCYNVGIVKGNSYYLGGIAGRIYKGNLSQGKLENCYYLRGVAIIGKDSIQNGVGAGYNTPPTPDVLGASTAKTEKQFESGEVAYLLGEAFGQTIGTDELPVLDGAKIYCGYNDCGMVKLIYSNSPFTDEIPDCNHEVGDLDHDGKVTIRDGSTISKHLAGCTTLSERQLPLADANSDGEINISDVTYIQKMLAEII